MLCFNAALAPKPSRAKWRAKQVWKESDEPPSQMTLELQSEMALLDMSENSRCSGDSDSGVQENHLGSRRATSQRTTDSKMTPQSSELRTLLAEVGVKVDSDITMPFNVVQLNSAAGNSCPDKLSFERMKPHNEEAGIEDEELEEEKLLFQRRMAYNHESDESNSDLNTMSDIPSISAMADSNSFHMPEALPHETVKADFKACAGTQTYFTGDIMSKQVYHVDNDKILSGIFILIFYLPYANTTHNAF